MATLPANVTPLSKARQSSVKEVFYVQPSLDELMNLCHDFELIADVQTIGDGYAIRCKDETFHVSAKEATILIKGLLIGHFAFHTRDDLSLANWSH